MGSLGGRVVLLEQTVVWTPKVIRIGETGACQSLAKPAKLLDTCGFLLLIIWCCFSC